MAVDWEDVEAIALLLAESYPDVDPSSLHFHDLREMIRALPGMGGHAKPLEADVVEAIQEAWNEQLQEEEVESAR